MDKNNQPITIVTNTCDDASRVVAVVERPLALPLGIVEFILRHPTQPVIIDYLNVMISDTFSAKTVNDLVAAVSQVHVNKPIIIVTKTTQGWPALSTSEARLLTKTRPDVLVIECHTHGARKADLGPYRALVEADDHMVSKLDLALRSAGCGPVVLSHDRYRNKVDITRNMVDYEYTVVSMGEARVHVLEARSQLLWIREIITRIRPVVSRCFRVPSTSRCDVCRINVGKLCRWCGTCGRCARKLATWAWASG